MLLEESRYIEQYLEARWALYYGYISNAHITSQSHAFFLKEIDLNHIAHPFTLFLFSSFSFPFPLATHNFMSVNHNHKIQPNKQRTQQKKKKLKVI